MRRGVVIGLCLGAAVVAGGGWLGHLGLELRSTAQQVQVTGPAYARAVRTGQATAVPALRADLDRELQRASALTRDPLWRLLGHVPVLGDPLRTSSRLAELGRVVDRDVLPDLQVQALAVTSRPLVRDGVVDLDRLRALGPVLAHASTVLAAHDVSLPDHLLPRQLARVRDEVARQLPRAVTQLRQGAALLAVAPAMLGADGPRTYFVAVQNNAESRATGGLIGAYAVLKADAGRLTRVKVGTDADLHGTTPGTIDVGKEYFDHYAEYGGLTQWYSTGLTPDWPTDARVLQGLWQAQGGGHVDGVIGLDPVALSDLLAATGPVTTGGRTTTAANVVDFIERDEYVEFSGREDGPRKRVLADLAQGLFDGILHGSGSATELVKQLGKAGSTGHLQLWSEHPAEQAAVLPLRASGALPARKGAFLEVTTQNSSGSKADYYLHRTVTYAPTGPGRGRVTIRLQNTIDPATASPYALIRLDDPKAVKGSVSLLLAVHGAVGGTVRMTGDYTLRRGLERGHPWSSQVVVVLPGKDLVVTADVTGMTGDLRYRQQPLVRDDVLHLPRGSFVG